MQWGSFFAPHLKRVLQQFPALPRSLLKLFRHFNGKFRPGGSLQLDIHVALFSIQESPFLHLEAVYVLECPVGVQERASRHQSHRRCAVLKKRVWIIIFVSILFRPQLPFEFEPRDFLHFLAVTRSGPDWAGTFCSRKTEGQGRDPENGRVCSPRSCCSA